MNADSGRRTILIVDDEAPLLRLLTRVLERDGFATLTAASGVEAVARLDEHANELAAMILDVFIPPGGVDQVIDRVVALRPELPLIFSSGDLPTPELSARIESLGATFLRKPFQPRVLVELVTRAAAVETGEAAGSPD